MSEARLELSEPRRIRLHDRSHAFTIICRRLEPADWAVFFGATSMSSEQRGAERISISDFDTPRAMLAERVITSAEGYKVEGEVELTSLPNWVTRLPLGHRQMIGAQLAGARVSEAGDLMILSEGECITIDSPWSIDAETGKMVAYQGLQHRLKTPSAEHQRRYNRASSRSIIVGGGRNGRTIYPGSQDVLVELYDELIMSVDGYSWKGLPVSGVPQIRDTMDGWHKFTVAQALFNPSNTVSTEGDAE